MFVFLVTKYPDGSNFRKKVGKFGSEFESFLVRKSWPEKLGKLVT